MFIHSVYMGKYVRLMFDYLRCRHNEIVSTKNNMSTNWFDFGRFKMRSSERMLVGKDLSKQYTIVLPFWTIEYKSSDLCDIFF